MEKKAVIQEGITPETQNTENLYQTEITKVSKVVEEASSKLLDYTPINLAKSVANKLTKR